MSISLGIDVGAVSVKLAALSSREDCALLARVAEASPASRGVLSVMAFYEKVIKVKADVAAYLINCFPSA
jgi:hypothetical protein